jgi:hypothetical protein
MVLWRRTLQVLQIGSANKATRGTPGTGKFWSRRILVDGWASKLSASAVLLQGM